MHQTLGFKIEKKNIVNLKKAIVWFTLKVHWAKGIEKIIKQKFEKLSKQSC